MRHFLYFLLIGTLLVGCKPTNSVIITSKDIAIKNGIYQASEPNLVTSTNVVTEKTETQTTTPKSSKKQKKNTEKIVVETTQIISKNKINDEIDPDFKPDPDKTPYFVKQLINTAMEYSGVRYRGGGTTTDGMDCSGLVYTCFNTFDISLPRSSREMAKIGNKISTNEVKKGDLIFFRTGRRNVISHVGLVTEVTDDEIKFIHSSSSSGVIVSSLNEPYYQRTFVQVNRVLTSDIL